MCPWNSPRAGPKRGPEHNRRPLSRPSKHHPRHASRYQAQRKLAQRWKCKIHNFLSNYHSFVGIYHLRNLGRKRVYGLFRIPPPSPISGQCNSATHILVALPLIFSLASDFGILLLPVISSRTSSDAYYAENRVDCRLLARPSVSITFND